MNKAPIAAILATVGLVAFGVYRALAPPPPPEPTTRIDVGGVALQFLTPYLRPDSLGAPTQERVTLAAFYPDFAPAGSGVDVTGKSDLAARFAKLVTIVIMRAGPDLGPEERVEKIYLRFLADGDGAQTGGLASRAFKPDSPFAGDLLFYAPPDGREFAARCPRDDSARATPTTCAYSYRLDGLEIEARFPAALMPQWRAIKAGVSGLVASARR